MTNREFLLKQLQEEFGCQLMKSDFRGDYAVGFIDAMKAAVTIVDKHQPERSQHDPLTRELIERIFWKMCPGRETYKRSKLNMLEAINKSADDFLKAGDWVDEDPSANSC